MIFYILYKLISKMSNFTDFKIVDEIIGDLTVYFQDAQPKDVNISNDTLPPKNIKMSSVTKISDRYYYREKKCEHNRPRYRCKKCGTGLCEHGKYKYYSKQCGTGHCKHRRQKGKCKQCGTYYCRHGNYKYLCDSCGTRCCEHRAR